MQRASRKSCIGPKTVLQSLSVLNFQELFNRDIFSSSGSLWQHVLDFFHQTKCAEWPLPFVLLMSCFFLISGPPPPSRPQTKCLQTATVTVSLALHFPLLIVNHALCSSISWPGRSNVCQSEAQRHRDVVAMTPLRMGTNRVTVSQCLVEGAVRVAFSAGWFCSSSSILLSLFHLHCFQSLGCEVSGWYFVSSFHYDVGSLLMTGLVNTKFASVADAALMNCVFLSSWSCFSLSVSFTTGLQ